MATSLGSKTVGSIVKLKENGTLVDFLVVHQGKPSSLYDSSCDGTWLLRKDLHSSRVWEADNVNKYESSDIDTWLNGDYLKMFDSNIQNAVKQVKIPYRSGGGSGGTDRSGSSGLSRKIFLLSGYEVGWTTSTSSAFPHDGDVLDYFKGLSSVDSKRIAYLNGSAAFWWLRSPDTGRTNRVLGVLSDGDWYRNNANSSYGIRPALILPSTLLVSDDGTVSTNTAPTMPSSINVPSSIQGGTTITVSWGASSDAESNLAGYKVERSTNGGSQWTQIYQGTALSTTNAVEFGTASVMYRVKAYDTQGLESGYRTSAQVTVVNNVAPGNPASITVPAAVKGSAGLVITWGAATDSDNNLSGYELERKYNGGSYAQIYKGPNLTFTDTITKGWTSVQYRVRAYDKLNAYSGYVESPSRTVDNNTAPTITCASPSGSDLGTKTEGFSVTYSVDDVDTADALTVTETLDTVQKRQYTPTRKQNTTFDLTGEYFQKILNGKHTLTITVSDGKASATHTLTFTKKVNNASITLKEPLDADAEITLAVLSVIGSIPTDAEYKVEVTNNAKDDSPVWQDVTASVKSGANIVFTNRSQTKGWAFNFRITVKEGPSGVGGYISSVQGGFQ